MLKLFLVVTAVVTLALVGVAALGISSCMTLPAGVNYVEANDDAADTRNADQSSPKGESEPTSDVSEVDESSEPRIKRVGGDTAASAEIADGRWRAGRSYIEGDLPQGYVEPTPPGAIDIKRYTSVRRAEIALTGVTPDNAGRASNAAFMPLFRHIQREGIAMTSPVEAEYAGMPIDAALPSLERVLAERADVPAKSPSGEATMIMSFLYRTPDMGEVGVDDRDARVNVIETNPVTVLAMGYAGPYGMSSLDDEREALAGWLAEHAEVWEYDPDAAFTMRVLSYNGPSVPRSIRWGELQVPIRRVGGGGTPDTPQPVE